jgi:hypothetical protein
LYVLEALIEAAMTYGFSGSGHVGAMLSRFGADHRIERERLETMVATKLIHLLLHTIDEIRIRLLFCRRPVGSHLAEVRRSQCSNALVLLCDGRCGSDFNRQTNAYGKIQTCGNMNHTHLVSRNPIEVDLRRDA